MSEQEAKKSVPVFVAVMFAIVASTLVGFGMYVVARFVFDAPSDTTAAAVYAGTVVMLFPVGVAANIVYELTDAALNKKGRDHEDRSRGCQDIP